ncbi:hypothetical protein I5M32_08730 [Pedobacter sp. SD-b]|uniref:Membrane protein involved in the export of O-antigen and teichoic acid n=1 Tax=Pedobacter segetis TaxID=2793069 RepID=A0ABS1BJL5_9SPHI|nr:hypothetical protein [Pedobacter segetis]MBK0383042.1 hypothetical protein [Pedobacter segetis]
MTVNKIFEKVVRNEGFSLVLGNSLLSVFTFLSLVILSHNLSPGIYGKLREILLYAGLIIQFGSAGFSQTVYYYLNLESFYSKRETLIKQVRIFQIILLTVSLIIFATIFIVFFKNQNGLNLTEILSIGLYVLFTGFSVIDLNIALVYKKYLPYIKYNIVIQILRCTLFLIFTYLSMDLTNILLLNAVIQIFITAVNWMILESSFMGVKSWRIDVVLQRNLMNYSTPLFFSTISSFFIANTGKLILSLNNASPINFAVFTNVTSDVPFVGNVYLSYFTIALPGMVLAFQKKNYQELIKLRFDYISKVIDIVLPLSVAIVVWHKELISIFFGNIYANYSYLFAIYSMIGLLRVCSHHDVLLSSNKTKYIFYFQFVELILHVILSMILYHYLGILGLVIATVITNYTYIFLVNVYSARVLKTNVFAMFPYFIIFKNTLILCISAIFLSCIFDKIMPKSSFYVSITVWAVFILLIKKKSIRSYLTNDG